MRVLYLRLSATIFSPLTTARKGLGTNGGTGNHVQGVSNDVEAKEELAKEEKGKGNRAFQEKRFKDAIKHFSVCIKLDEVSVAHLRYNYLYSDICILLQSAAFAGGTATRAVYHSNRSAAYAALKARTHQFFLAYKVVRVTFLTDVNFFLPQDFEAALADGLSAVKFSRDWVKGHIRVGAACMGLKRFTDARESYEKALALEEDNEQIKISLNEAAAAEEASIRQGNFVFQSKRKRSTGGDSSSAVPKAKQLKDTKLLSFDDGE